MNVPIHKRITNGFDIEHAVELDVIKYREELGPFGRILIRKSGTEQVVRVMVEGLNQKVVRNIASDLSKRVALELENNFCN